MRALLLAVSLIAPVLATPARAGEADAVPFFMSGQALWEPCDWPTEDAAATAACVLYVVGVIDALNLTPSTRICMKMSSDKIEVANVVKQWLAKHPERRGDPAARLVRAAMDEAFPCK